MLVERAACRHSRLQTTTATRQAHDSSLKTVACMGCVARRFIPACLSLSSGSIIAPIYGGRLELPAGWPVRMRFFQSRSGRGMV